MNSCRPTPNALPSTFGCRVFVAGLMLSLLVCNDLRGERPDVIGRVFQAEDSLQLNVAERADRPSQENQKTAGALEQLGWTAEAFNVTCERPAEWRYDCLIRFPSAGSTSQTPYDAVAAEWHMARNEDGEIVEAPGLIVVHESGRGMTVGKTFAMLLSRAGLHTFMVQLPGYGVRKDPERKEQASDTVNLMRQAVRDVRRTRDAISSLPLVNKDHIGIQGTSLGGFVAATAAGLDGCFDSVFIMLAGGNVYAVIEKGERDAARVREKLAAEGLSGERLKTLLESVEPIHLAHRIEPDRTWLFSAKRDQVVPMENAYAWAKAVGLQSDHHIIIDADHYSGVTHLPTMVLKVRDTVQEYAGRKP